jgi:hypothetical protein
VSFVFEDLSATDTVLIDLVEAGQYWKNSAPATFLRNCGGKWTVIEAPKASALAEARDAACASATDTSSACVAAAHAASTAAVGQPGFFGELMTFNSGNAYGLTVRDGQSYVSDYFYTESTDRVVHLGPGKGLNPKGGRVSMTGTKTSPNNAADWLHVDNWVGNFTILKSNIQVQSDQGTSSLDLSASTAPATSNILFLVSDLCAPTKSSLQSTASFAVPGGHFAPPSESLKCIAVCAVVTIGQQL